MKNLRNISILAAAAGALALTAACGPRGGGEIPVLDVTKSYPARNIVLQDIADVEYIPLETREGFLVDNLYVRYIDDEIVVTSNRVGDIMFFDRHTGRGLKTFNRTGRGPGEYTGIANIAVDRGRNEMFVTPNSISSGGYPIYVYGLDGKPMRTHLFKNIRFPAFFHSYDDDRLFFYNSRTANNEPYGLISKTDTLVTYLPVKFDGRGTMSVVQEIEGGVVSYWSGDPIARTRDGFMISEPGVDTMFRWKAATGELVPVMSRTPAWTSMGEYPVGMFFQAETDDYIFLKTIERRWDFATGEGFEEVNLIYDRRAGEFFEGGVVNADYTDEQTFGFSINAGVPGGTYVTGLQAISMVDLHAAGKLNGRLAEIAPTLKEDDNPVMMIATFK
jgi:hypothetical protein